MSGATTSAPVVRVEMLGGLGNQLFQAAAGYALTKRLGATLQFDVSRYRQSGSRTYALSGLAHDAEVVGHSTWLSQRVNRVRRALRFGRPFAPVGWSGGAFRERSYAYDERFETLSGSYYLSGYFHSARYFAPFEADIRRAFDLAQVASPEAKAKAASLPAHSLAVHVRIGDFKSENLFNTVHGTLSPRYYRDAIAIVTAARPVERIYVFTDTPQAIPQLIPAGLDYEAVTGFSAQDDLFLMSRARHHIIANSTFSWWSAWFAPQADTLTCAPRAWLAPEALKKTYIGDLYPEGWVML
ncbi:MAG TPA: alpha-1,2-fucosyltransferase [Rhabdaerophilum sp.]|nr:alpha-1,2-fucosyltransferase [Rhabdaerophilum sp.]